MVSVPSPPGLERIEAFFTGHAYDPHRHDTYAIGLTMSGVQSFHYRGSRADSLAGHAIVLHPDEEHDGESGAAEGFRYRMLYLEPRLIQEALGGRRPLPFVPSVVTTDRRLVGAAAAALGSLGRMPHPLAVDSAVLNIAEALAALDGSQSARRPSPASARAVGLARHYLEDHLAEMVGSEELEGVTGLDRYELARHFRTLLGTSPYRYLTMRRLDRARALIRAGEPLAEVAAACGFADQSHMTRQFKRTYGLSPGRWKTMHAGA